MDGVATLADVEAIEARGFPSDLPASTYDVLRASAARFPDERALSFFLAPTVKDLFLVNLANRVFPARSST